MLAHQLAGCFASLICLNLLELATGLQIQYVYLLLLCTHFTNVH